MAKRSCSRLIKPVDIFGRFVSRNWVQFPNAWAAVTCPALALKSMESKRRSGDPVTLDHCKKEYECAVRDDPTDEKHLIRRGLTRTPHHGRQVHLQSNCSDSTVDVSLYTHQEIVSLSFGGGGEEAETRAD